VTGRVSAHPIYVIWSFDHQQWWAPLRRGYTPDLAKAGRYTAGEAGEIVTNSYLAEDVAIHEKLAERRGEPTTKGLWQ
jgi:hypothetical protein